MYFLVVNCCDCTFVLEATSCVLSHIIMPALSHLYIHCAFIIKTVLNFMWYVAVKADSMLFHYMIAASQPGNTSRGFDCCVSHNSMSYWNLVVLHRHNNTRVL